MQMSSTIPCDARLYIAHSLFSSSGSRIDDNVVIVLAVNRNVSPRVIRPVPLGDRREIRNTVGLLMLAIKVLERFEMLSSTAAAEKKRRLAMHLK